MVVHGNTSIIHATSEGLDEVGHVLRCGGDMESTLGAGEGPKRNLGPSACAQGATESRTGEILSQCEVLRSVAMW